MAANRSIWIDLDNTPHVPFFRPIIRELEARGETVRVTARQAFQVCELADLLGVRYEKIGRHYGKNPFLKIGGLLWRSLQLLPFVLRHRPALALSHGSRSQILLCNLLRIPTVMIMDYEHARTPLLLRPRWEIVPSAIKNEKLQCDVKERILTYNGIKEDVYAHDFKPDETLPKTLGFNQEKIIVTVRPPASEAHYHNPESDDLFIAFMHIACARNDVQIILLPRNKNQEAYYKEGWPNWFKDESTIIPNVAIDGLNLIWHSDLVVSGGGTMNREAAAIGRPVYSIFRGPLGSVDRELQREKRLVLIKDVQGVESCIALQKYQRENDENRPSAPTPLTEIIKHLGSIQVQESPSTQKSKPGEAR